MSIVFQQAHIISPPDGLDTKGSIRVSDNGIIETLSIGDTPIEPRRGEKVVAMEGKLLSPGLFDMHCHFREPGQEYKETLESGAAAAAAGGFTGVALMPNTTPVIDSPQGVTFIRYHAASLPVDLEVIAAMTEGSRGEKLTAFGSLKTYGVTAVSDDGTAIQASQSMRLAFEYASNFDMLIIQHCEDRSLTTGGVMNEGMWSSKLGLKGIPDISEAMMLARDLMLLRWLEEHKLHAPLSRPRYHAAHLSTAASLQLIREAKREGLQVSCEVTPHHFTLTDKDLYQAEKKGNFIMKPPLTSPKNRDAVLEALADGTADAIATDHAPHALHEKECPPGEASFGIIGLETSLGLTMTELVMKGVITMQRAVELLSVNPRKILQLPPIRIREGEKANLTLIDPEAVWRVDAGHIRSKSSNTPFIGRQLTGRPLGIYHKGIFTEAPGA